MTNLSVFIGTSRMSSNVDTLRKIYDEKRDFYNHIRYTLETELGPTLSEKLIRRYNFITMYHLYSKLASSDMLNSWINLYNEITYDLFTILHETYIEKIIICDKLYNEQNLCRVEWEQALHDN